MGYRFYIVKTHRNSGEESDAKIRVSPIAGQGLPTSMKVECSRSMRKEYPVGTLFRLKAKITDKEGGTPFLYSPPHWEYAVVSENEIRGYISES